MALVYDDQHAISGALLVYKGYMGRKSCFLLAPA